MKYFSFSTKNELIYYDESGQDNDNLPVPMYTYIIPYMGHQFILNIIFSLVRFETEVDLTMYRILHDAPRYVKLIGTNDDEESLKHYSRSLLRSFIEEKLVHLPN